MIKDFFNKLFSIEGLDTIKEFSENKPDIEWVKAMFENANMQFGPPPSREVAEMLGGNTIMMKIRDEDRYFVRGWADQKAVWHINIGADQHTFRSPYLDSMLLKAIKGGLQPQHTAADLEHSIERNRDYVRHNGTEEDIANLNKTLPLAPVGFTNAKTPEYYDKTAPDFAAFLRRIEHEPFKFEPPKKAPAPQIQPMQPQ